MLFFVAIFFQPGADGAIFTPILALRGAIAALPIIVLNGMVVTIFFLLGACGSFRSSRGRVRSW